MILGERYELLILLLSRFLQPPVYYIRYSISFSILLSVYSTFDLWAEISYFIPTHLFFLGATAPIWALAYLSETLYFISVF
jgi:hypothetical protein